MSRVIKGWLRDLPNSWNLPAGQNLHVYIVFQTDVARVIDLYDTLLCRGYRVLHSKHSAAGSKTIEESAGVILVLAPNDPAWCDEQQKRLQQYPHVVIDPKTEPPITRALTVLNAMYKLAGKTPSQNTTEMAKEIDQSTNDALKTLDRLSAFPSSPGPEWDSTPALANRLAEKLIEMARYNEAIAVLQEVGKSFEETVRWRQLSGLAYRRLGDVPNAMGFLKQFYDGGHRDPESLGMYASTFMSLYDRQGDRNDLKRSRDIYAEAFKHSPADYYTGINAATKSLFLDEREAAQGYVEQVQRIVDEELGAGKEDYWLLFTAAEVQLILKNYAKAATLYYEAVIKSPGKTGSHMSTWLQARRLMDKLDTPQKDRDAIWCAFRHITDSSPGASVLEPPCRRLRVFAFDPSMGRHLQTAPINEVTLKIPWEGKAPIGKSALGAGPVGEYLEVVDYDPASGYFYEPLDLDDERLLAADGLAPSEGDPQFHQQMVYAVGMNLIDHFERALGRKALWADHQNARRDPEFVQRLRIYPHALREANAYYSPAKKALLFGYFWPEAQQSEDYGPVFTCLSHDVIAHEMSHALLDGLHPSFTEPSNGDVFAFHEAFADLVALFQHFSHSEVLLHEIARTRSDLGTENLLGQLAQQFGRAIGRRGALRDALGGADRKSGEWRPSQPSPRDLERAHEPHDRGAILVAAVFDAFVSIYKSRVADLLRIATQGSGILAPGALHPDLVARLAATAAKVATHFLRLCIRALDYCPPVDITLGDYLRALITADLEFVRDDRYNYRLALLEGFERRGIYPRDVRNISIESLVWRPPQTRGQSK
jgi:tetratricopeptide (TPR) repeat protein